MGEDVVNFVFRQPDVDCGYYGTRANGALECVYAMRIAIRGIGECYLQSWGFYAMRIMKVILTEGPTSWVREQRFCRQAGCQLVGDHMQSSAHAGPFSASISSWTVSEHVPSYQMEYV